MQRVVRTVSKQFAPGRAAFALGDGRFGACLRKLLA
jgi:hypothetical protein